MSTPKKWSNVAIAMQSAIAAAKTLSAITLASPGVASSTAHGYSNGDFVLLAVQGMWQVDGMVVRVAGVTADTFELEGVDTTAFDAFSSGTAEKLTFGTSIAGTTTLAASGGDFGFIDTTTVQGNAKSQIPDLPAPATYTMTQMWDISDAGLLAMKSASDAQAKRAFKFTFGTGGNIMVFDGYVGCSLLPGGSAQQLVTSPAVITMHGKPNYYAS